MTTQQSSTRRRNGVDRATSMRLICAVFLVGLTPIGKRRDEVGEVFFLSDEGIKFSFKTQNLVILGPHSRWIWGHQLEEDRTTSKLERTMVETWYVSNIFVSVNLKPPLHVLWASIDFGELSLTHQFQRRNSAFLWRDPKSSEIGHD